MLYVSLAKDVENCSQKIYNVELRLQVTEAVRRKREGTKYLAELAYVAVTSSLKRSQLQLSRGPGAARNPPKLPCNSKGTITLWGKQQTIHKSKLGEI
jgi:hypothetical protein